MKKFEYKIENIYNPSDYQIGVYMNKMGEIGWELVSVTMLPVNGQGGHLYFKRRILKIKTLKLWINDKIIDKLYYGVIGKIKFTWWDYQYRRYEKDKRKESPYKTISL